MICYYQNDTQHLCILHSRIVKVYSVHLRGIFIRRNYAFQLITRKVKIIILIHSYLV